MASMRESRDSDLFLVNTQVQSHALLRQGFGISVPCICKVILVRTLIVSRARLSRVRVWPARLAHATFATPTSNFRLIRTVRFLSRV